MALYELEYDEGIVLQSTTAMLGGATEEEFENEELMELIVTNKRIIYIVEISTGFFSKAKTEVRQVPISSIKVINGVPQVKQVNHDMWGHCVQVQFTHGIEYWTLEKKKLPEWVSEITRLLVGAPEHVSHCSTPVMECAYEDEKKASAFGVLFGFASALKNAADTAKQTVSTAIKQVSEETESKPDIPEAPPVDNHKDTTLVVREDEPKVSVKVKEPTLSIQVEKQSILQATEGKKFIFCCNCGEKLTAGSKFCNACGTPTGNVKQKKDESTVEPVTATILTSPTTVEPVIEPTTERKSIYEGELHKCPNCGDIMDAYESICESCGYERRGIKAVSSVQELSRELQVIEAQRPTTNVNIFSFHRKQMEESAGIIPKTDQQKIELIKNFPIPNTKEDMYEFLMLAISNIDARTYGLGGGSHINEAITNAWYTKLEQAYTKAKFSFGKQADFAEITALYQEKHKDIASAKKRKVRIILSIVFGSISFTLAIIAMIVILSINAAKKNEKIVAQENERLNAVVQDIKNALDDKDYEYALMNADSLIFDGYDSELESEWENKRNYWVNKVIEDAFEDGVELERPVGTFDLTKENSLGKTQYEFKYENFMEVKKELEERGFTNITTQGMKDLKSDSTSAGKIDKITVDGETGFPADIAYSLDVEIIIYYHSNKE